jgi:hypothetical protein
MQKGKDSKDVEPKAQRVLSPEAQRALAEAEERRKRGQDLEAVKKGPKEIGGPAGPEPTRYGDWEKKGIVSDF